MMKRHKKKKFIMPSKVWVITETIKGEYWGPEGWTKPPGEVFLFETFLEADEVFASILGKLFGAEIVEYEL